MACSHPIPVQSGVVQGSVIGLLAFTVFINDLPRKVKNCRSYMFADDAILFGDAGDDQQCDSIQCNLGAVYDWAEENKLSLSLPKCVSLHYGHRNRQRQYALGGVAIKSEQQSGDLSVIRSANFRYDAHVRNIILKASRLAGMSWRVFATRSQQFQANLFAAYIRPLIEYASQVWNPIDIDLCEALERVQRCFKRRIFGLRRLPYPQRLAELNLPTLKRRRDIAYVVFAYRMLHGLVKVDCAEFVLSLSTLST